MRHQLDNGLTVLVKENHAARVVAFQAWVDAGSADETDAESGLAHLHEHMLFKGTARRGVGEIARAVEAAGGDINAWTSFDQTVYHLVMASRDVDVGLDILADALQHSAFDPVELAREQEVVLEEIKRTYDLPARRASRDLFGLAYTKHPYRKPVIGNPETVRGFHRDDVLAFFEKHYRPENVTLVLVGDVETDAALERIDDLFGGWRPDGPARPASQRDEEPAQEGLRLLRREDDVKEAHLELAWHVPGLSHPDVAAIDILTLVLGQGESSRLVRTLRRRQHLANEVFAYAYTPKDPGLIMVSAQAAPEKAERVLEGLLETAYRLREERLPEDELEKARSIIEADSVYQRETVQGQARKLGFFQTVAGGVEFEEAYYHRVRRVTADDVRRVARTYLSTEGLSMVALLPEGGALPEVRIEQIAGDAERDHAPAAAPARRRPEETIERMTLDNGATLIAAADHHVPLVAMRAVFTGGLRYETKDTNGIHFLMARMLTSGTERRTAEQIAREVDAWAASIAGASGRNSFGLGGEILSRHLEEGLELFAECLTGASYPDDEFEKERSQQLEEIRTRDDDPAGVAFDLFAETLWQRHPYRMDVLGTPVSLTALTPKDLRAFHASHYPVSRLHLAIVGDVEPERARDLVEEALGRGAGEATEPHPEIETFEGGPRRHDRVLAKAQAHIVLGFPGVRLTDPERFPLEVLSTILAGQGGRLFVELRDKRSMAYSVTSYSLEGIDPGYVAVYLGCSPEKVDEAIAAIRVELARVRDAPPTADEIERARRYLVGAHEIGLQKAAARAAIMAFDDAYGVGYDEHLRYASEIERIGPGEVQEAARRFLDPEREVLAVVRPEAS